MKKFIGVLFALMCATAAHANVPCTVPFNLLNGTTADASQVMANYNAILTCLGNAAAAGANNDITSLNALSTPISPAAGGSTIYVGGISTGTANAQVTAVLVPSGFSLVTGKSVIFQAGFTNLGPATLNANGTGIANLFVNEPWSGPAALVGGEIQLGQLYWAVYDGAEYIVMNPSPIQATRTVTGGTPSVINKDDHGKLILGGGAFYTLNLAAPASYTDPNFWVDVVNNDTRAKLMSVSGVGIFYLYPTQIKRFFISSSVWAWTPAFERWKKGGAQLFADVTNGNDGNDCLGSGTGNACQHICTAITRMYTDIDNQNAAPTINVAGGIYTESCAEIGQPTGVNVFNIAFTGTATWKPNGTSPNLFVQDGAEAILNGTNLTLTNLGGSSGVAALAVHQTAVLDVTSGFTIGTYSGGTYFQCDHGGGNLNLPATWTINGTVGNGILLGGGCTSTWAGGGTVTVNGGSVCGTFATLTGSGANLAMGTVGFSGSESAGCTQYTVILNATLSLGGSGTAGGTCPAGGNLAVAAWGGTGGSCTTGGQVIQ